MGIYGLEKFLASHDGCMVNVSIETLVKETGRKIIVVDGFNFYGSYVYKKFDWKRGGVRDLVEIVQTFVTAFRRVGAELEFFFTDGHLDEGIDLCGSESWVKRHSSFVEYTKKFFNEFRSRDGRGGQKGVASGRSYYCTPFHALPVVLFALRQILHCKVHFEIAGYRTPNTAYYVRDKVNNCLALLAQDNYYIFYKGLEYYLSLFHLNINEMTTKKYCASPCATYYGVQECHLYPVFVDGLVGPCARRILVQISTVLNECKSPIMALNKIQQYRNATNPKEVFGLENEEINDKTKKLISKLFQNVFFFNYERLDNLIKVVKFGPFKKWTTIRNKAFGMYFSGKLSFKIVNLLSLKEFVNDNILEDFEELPPSSYVYQPLRRKLYGILFAEEEHDESEDSDNENDESEDTESEHDDNNDNEVDICKKRQRNEISSENSEIEINKIREWCMSSNGCSETLCEIDSIDPALHPGLLTLWDLNSLDDIQTLKWRLFAHCVSSTLDYNQLREIPPTLVVPTAVLYYLSHEVPNAFKGKLFRLIEPWEVEVFIAQAVLAPEMSVKELRRLAFRYPERERVIKISAAFVYGCQTVNLLVEACGFPVSRDDMSLWHFFDGVHFHSLYARAEESHRAEQFCDIKSRVIFQKMKQIIFPH